MSTIAMNVLYLKFFYSICSRFEFLDEYTNQYQLFTNVRIKLHNFTVRIIILHAACQIKATSFSLCLTPLIKITPDSTHVYVFFFNFSCWY